MTELPDNFVTQQKTTFHSFVLGTVGNFMEEVGLWMKEVEQSKLFALKNTARAQSLNFESIFSIAYTSEDLGSRKDSLQDATNISA